ncbi:MAG TPA: TonB-dependent receptor, partial [Vicinamibacteria bacterium]|nr:TonB-dependent receptor [Vicinamibacteria bacterium]
PPTSGLTDRPLTALEAFAAGLPALYFQGYGHPAAEGTSRNLALFVSDDWRVAPRLTVAAGLRYQHFDLGVRDVTVSAPGGTRLTYDVPRRGDLAPRLSVSFDPTGRGRTVLRASGGVFHEDPLLAVALVTDIVNGERLRLLQAGLPLSAQAWRSPDHRLPEPSSPFPSLVQVVGPGFRAPSSRQVTVGVTHQLGRDLSLTADVIAVRGVDQIGIVDYNPLLPALGPGRRPNDVGGVSGTSASVNQFTNYGESDYRGLALSLRKRMGTRLDLLASYTLSRAEDTGSDMFGQQNVAEDAGVGRDMGSVAGLPLGFAPEAFRGPSGVDQRHRFVLSAIVELPWSFSLSTIVTVGSGRPFTALSGIDGNGDGVAANDRARRDPADPASRVVRNAERMAGTSTVDLRVARRFRLARGTSLDALLEAFNLLDRVNYSEVNNVFGTGAFPDDPQRNAAGQVTYGRYTRASAPRQLQLALRFAF